MSEKKPTALFSPSPGTKCPVCQETTYSAGGIHPQCAVKRSDEPRRLALVAEKKKLKDKPKNE